MIGVHKLVYIDTVVGLCCVLTHEMCARVLFFIFLPPPLCLQCDHQLEFNRGLHEGEPQKSLQLVCLVAGAYYFKLLRIGRYRWPA